MQFSKLFYICVVRLILVDFRKRPFQFAQFELGKFKAISADVRINPDLAGHANTHTCML